MAPVAGDPARDVLVRDATAQRSHLTDLGVRVSRALVLVFLRQYGCPLCREQAVALRDRFAAFLAASVAVAAVGQETPEDAQHFHEQLALPFPVLSDTPRSAYAAYGLMDRTIEQIFGPTPGRRMARVILLGNLPHRTVGSVHQVPGMFVIDRDGTVQFAHPGRHAANAPETDTLLARVIAAVPDRSPATWAVPWAVPHRSARTEPAARTAAGDQHRWPRGAGCTELHIGPDASSQRSVGANQAGPLGAARRATGLG